jgi:arylsulfatase A-like enzyme
MGQSVEISRRRFLGGLGAGAWLGATGVSAGAPQLRRWTPPPALRNPNVLLIIVDQMRFPAWLGPKQQAELNQTILPNIGGRIQSNSYNFTQFFAAATACTPSRAALLTGLYAPQTAMYVTGDGFIPPHILPSLNPAYPTWGHALAALNPAYQGNIWWFGKWHLSDSTPLSSTPLAPYGFQTRTYPGGATSPYNPSPNGTANEGTDGGLFGGVVRASDSEIASDFVGWIEGQAPTTGQPQAPWCATVSLINPHDITFAPAWLQSNPFPPTGVPKLPVYYPPPSGSPPSFYKHKPSPWNYEQPRPGYKPALQYAFYLDHNAKDGVVHDWVLFLNQYFWLQNFVDQQVGEVLDALAASAFANNTIVIFLSDHGEYAGSHGLHDKGAAVYEESIHVPLAVHFPGQTGTIAMSQMCSGVDFFGLMCDLATGGSGQWKSDYPNLANRQSLWSFLYHNRRETRVAPAPVSLPYIFHTYDDVLPGQALKNNQKSHIAGLRTKLDAKAGIYGAKLAYYWQWGKCTTYPDSTAPDPEFYDYNPSTTGNTSELGNDYHSTNPAVQATIAQYDQVLGTWGPPGSGLIASELNAPLVGTGLDGKPLSAALAAAQQTYFDFAFGKGVCGA